MEYHSKYTGAEVDALLDKIAEDNVGDIDSALSTTSENPVQNKVITEELGKKATKEEVSSLSTVVGEELNTLNESILENGEKISSLDANKADTSGYYPAMRVGLSDNLPDRGDVIEGEIGFRESAGAGNSIEDGTANVQELMGNSVVWNQMASKRGNSYTAAGVTATWEGSKIHLQGVYSASGDRNLYSLFRQLSLRAGHKYALILQGGQYTAFYTMGDFIASNIYKEVILEANGDTGDITLRVDEYASTGQSIDEYVTMQITDLTQMFQAGNEPSTIEEFEAVKNQLVGIDFNAYNAGEVLGVNIKGIKSVNDNAWDEEWEANVNTIISKNFNRCIGGETYHARINNADYDDIRFWLAVRWFDKNKNQIQEDFCNNRLVVCPSNAWYFKISTNSSTYVYGNTYNHDICIRLAHSGYKTDYVPHEEDTMPLDLSEVFPNGMHGINGVRDSVTPKKATRRFGVVDMGDMAWSYDSSNQVFSSYTLMDLMTHPAEVSERNKGLLCSKYSPSSTYIALTMDDKSWLRIPKSVTIKDTSYSDAATFKAAMSGVMLYYELAEPIETEIDPKLNLSYKVWDFGTEELLTDSKSAPVLARTIYGFNATDTIRGNKAKNEEQDERLHTLEGEVVRIGDYSPENKVGLADDLAGRGESVPAEFGFRASGGKSIKDGRAYIKRIKGNSVVWNQLLPNSTNIVTSSGTKALNEGTRIVAGHKYLLFADFDGGTDYASVSLFTRVNGESKSILHLGNNEGKTYKFVTPEIGGVSDGTSATVEGNVWQYFYFIGTTESITNTRLIDLTQMFDAGNEPTTIEDFNTRVATLGVDMNAYNEGQVIHCNTESIKSVGDNAWDEVVELGSISSTSGENIPNDNAIRPKNYIKILPNEQYHINVPFNEHIIFYDERKQFLSTLWQSSVKTFTTPSNAAYMRFRFNSTYGTTYNHDIMITLVHSGWKQDTDAGYQPYWQDTLPLPIISKYFPNGMKSAGTAHDEVRFNKASGKWEAVQRIGEAKMKDLSWLFNEHNIFSVVINDMYIAKDNAERKEGILSARYGISESFNVNTEMSDKSILRASKIYLRDTTYSDSASFKASLTDEDILYYELAEPIVTELDAEDQNFRDYYNVADFGTEQSQSSVPSANFSADIIYQFNAVDMIREHEIEIAELQSIIATMQAQLASLTSNNA